MIEDEIYKLFPPEATVEEFPCVNMDAKVYGVSHPDAVNEYGEKLYAPFSITGEQIRNGGYNGEVIATLAFRSFREMLDESKIKIAGING